MIKDLAKKFATLEKFTDDVVAEIKFFRGEFEPELKILKDTREFKLILITSETEKILIKLVTPRKKIRPAKGVRVQAEGKTQFFFSATDVSDFVEEIGEQNKIYKFSPPIVPPLLILETLLKFENFSSCENLKLSFRHFITAYEPLTFKNISEKNFEIQSADVVKVLISTD